MSEDYGLGIAANIAAILTAVIATVAYARFLWERRQKRLRLENHLKEERETGFDQGNGAILNLVAHLGMTEAEIIDAAFRSKFIQRRVALDQNGRADRLLLSYEMGDIEKDYPRRPGKPRF
ncbi:hypothetical protein [Rhizobium sullae]|uniref:Uncharacterized protein n=1 Tax=Rhizobium sullae TaxID=50338 RepID=A0A4R3Q5I8_RHISU|nr:hypothetical protein [Rhizobium sullae]TCU14502.1 hypothetical protein EV132_109225 [Rhizobium sullae]